MDFRPSAWLITPVCVVPGVCVADPLPSTTQKVTKRHNLHRTKTPNAKSQQFLAEKEEHSRKTTIKHITNKHFLLVCSNNNKTAELQFNFFFAETEISSEHSYSPGRRRVKNATFSRRPPSASRKDAASPSRRRAENGRRGVAHL